MYCKKVCGDDSFSIDDWNEAYEELEKSPLSEEEKDKILFPPQCKTQCFDCMATIGQRRLRTKEIISKMKSSEVYS